MLWRQSEERSSTEVRRDLRSDVPFAASDLGCLNGTHLCHPTLGRLELPHRADLIARITRYTDIVVTLENELYITDLKYLRATCFGAFAGSIDHLIDEFIGNAKNVLVNRSASECEL